MATTNPVDQALLDLQQVQSTILRLANKPLAAAEAIALSNSIGKSVDTVRATLARAAQALRGHVRD